MKHFKVYEAITRMEYGPGKHVGVGQHGVAYEWTIDGQKYIVRFNFDGSFTWIF